MSDDLRQELTGWGEVVWEDKTYSKIQYQVIIEKEDSEDDEPDIYGTLDDAGGDKLDLAGFMASSKRVILNLEDNSSLYIVFLDESGEFEVDGGFHYK